jgi:hypothetical protein
MSFEIALENIPAGFAVESKAKNTPGPLMVRVTGFASYEDGDKLINILESVTESVISKLPKEAGIKESGIDHLLAIIRKDHTATVYINELKFIASVQVKKAPIKAGDPIVDDDIADIRKMRIEDVVVPSDAGVVLIISSGWRRAAFFDYAPIVPSTQNIRVFDLEVILGQMWAQLRFQDRFKITDAEWIELFRNQWFPFVSLGSNRIREMLNYIRNSWDLSQLLDSIEQDVKNRIPILRPQIAKGKCFDGHREILNEALDNFIAGKYISTSGLIYPRLEGVMRSRHEQVNPSLRASQANLSESATADPLGVRHSLSLLLPARFNEYLEKVYFADFDPKNVSAVSRNTVSHGVVPENMLADKKAAVLGVLILEQLAFLCAE